MLIISVATSPLTCRINRRKHFALLQCEPRGRLLRWNNCAHAHHCAPDSLVLVSMRHMVDAATKYVSLFTGKKPNGLAKWTAARCNAPKLTLGASRNQTIRTVKPEDDAQSHSTQMMSNNIEDVRPRPSVVPVESTASSYDEEKCGDRSPTPAPPPPVSELPTPITRPPLPPQRDRQHGEAEALKMRR